MGTRVASFRRHGKPGNRRGEGEGPGAAATTRPARRTRLALGGGPAARASVLGGQLVEEAREAAGAEVEVTRPVGDDADPRHPVVGFAAGLFEGGELLALHRLRR